MDIKVKEHVVKTVTLELTPDEAAMLWQVALYHHDSAANWHMTHESGGYKKIVTETGKDFFKALAYGIEESECLPIKPRATAYEQQAS